MQGDSSKNAEYEAKIQDALAKISDGSYTSIRSAGKQAGVSDEITDCVEFLLIILHR